MTKVHYADQRQFTKSEVFIVKRYVLELPNDQGISDVMRPDYWRNVAEQIQRLSVVTIIGGKDDLDIDVRCMASGKGYCMMRVIREAPRDVCVEEPAAGGSRHIEYRPGYKWCIVGSDGGILFPEYETRESAAAAMNNLENAEEAAA